MADWGVAVGGGAGAGDTVTFGIRAELRRKLSRRLFTKVGDPFMHIPVEIVDTKDTAIYYHVFAQQLEKIDIPRHLLSEGFSNPAQVNAVVDDILWFVNSLYPRYTGIPYTMENEADAPLSLAGLHPQSIEKVWCWKYLPISACR